MNKMDIQDEMCQMINKEIQEAFDREFINQIKKSVKEGTDYYESIKANIDEMDMNRIKKSIEQLKRMFHLPEWLSWIKLKMFLKENE